MKDEHSKDSFDDELAMRLSALAMGEASDFERSQLESLMSERPELLAAFAQLKRLQVSLAEMDLSENGESLPELNEADCKLSDVRRNHLLAVIQGLRPNPVQQQVTNRTPAANPSHWNRRRLAWWSACVATAASLLVCFGLLQESPLSVATSQLAGGSASVDAFRSLDMAEPAATMESLGRTSNAIDEAISDEAFNREARFSQNQVMKQLSDATAVIPPPSSDWSLEKADNHRELSAGGFGGGQTNDSAGSFSDLQGKRFEEQSLRGRMVGGVPGSDQSAKPDGEPDATGTLHHSMDSPTGQFGSAGEKAGAMGGMGSGAGQTYRWPGADGAKRAAVDPSISDLYTAPSPPPAPSAMNPNAAASVENFSIAVPQQPSASSSLSRDGAIPFGGAVNPDAGVPLAASPGKSQFVESGDRLGVTATDASPANGPVPVAPLSTVEGFDERPRDRLAPTDTEWMDFSSPADMPVAGQPSAMPPLGSAAASQTPRILVDGEEQSQSGFEADSDIDGLAEAMPQVALSITDGKDFDGPVHGGRELQLNQRMSEVALNEAAVEEKDVAVKQQEMPATPPGRRSRFSKERGETDGFAKDESKQNVAIESGKKLSDTSMLGENAATEIIAGLPMIAVPEIKRKEIRSLDELSAARDPFSTFSLHVSDVSFKLAAAALAVGQLPDPSKIRIEEFVNAFDYFDPLPTDDERVACQIEQAIHPFMLQRNVLRISLRTAATGRPENIPLRLTLLLDNSGSMERVDRKQTVRRAFESLAAQVKPNDQVTLISFANQPRLLAERFSGSQVADLVQLVKNLPSEGGTNLEAALKLAMEKASEGITPENAAGLQNRIVLMTDGAVNLGDANPASLSQLVSQMRDAGIAFDAAGISAHELNDGVLEALTRQGDGRYYLLDSAEDANAGFANQIAGALRPAAKNVKVQVEFNPDRVGQYKLLGFEKHLLKQEDFRNDKVDAAEMATAEAGVAIYQFEAKPDGRGDIGSVSVRFQDLATGTMIERRWPIPYEPRAARIHQSSPRLRLATTAAMFAAKLRGDAVGESVELTSLADLLTTLPANLEAAPRVRQLQTMINAARQIGEP